MREIEFRGKRIDNNKWVYGDLVQIEYKSLLNTNEKAYMIEQNNVSVTVLEESIGQYTGLQDKNGKKIFEEDILKYDGGGTYIVVFNEMMIMCPHDHIEMPSPGYYGILIGDKTKELCPLGVTEVLAEVIGNIHDNPELIEEGE